MNRIRLGIVFLLLVNVSLYSQDNNDVEVRWYTIMYAYDGTISELVEADEIIYNTPMLVWIVCNGFEENTSVRFSLIDDEGNTIFEQAAKTRNNEVQFELRLLTTEEYLLNAAMPYVRFRYEIYSKNQYHFESEYFDVAFAFRWRVIGSGEATTERYALRSTDGYYDHEVYVAKDGVFSGERNTKVFIFPNVIPGKYYSLYWINWADEDFLQLDTVPFHELLGIIVIEESEHFSIIAQISIVLACLLLLLISFVGIVGVYMKKKSRNIDRHDLKSTFRST